MKAERIGPRRIGWIYSTGTGRFLLSLSIALIALLFCLKFETIAYLTNDDNAIAYALAGYQTGAPYPYALFINCLLGHVVSALYTLVPAVPWWAVLQLSAIVLSFGAIGACLLGAFRRRGKGPVLPLLLYGILLLLCGMGAMVELTYTVTAAIIGSAACTLAIAGQAGSRRVTDPVAIFAMLLAFLMREETGFALLCFFALAWGYRFLTAAGESAILRSALRLALCLAVTVILCFSAFGFNNAMKVRVNGADYVEYFRYRERFTDYPRDSYEENPALYASVGWDETAYRLADSWCFLDERINADSLEKITQNSQRRGFTWSQTIRDGAELLERERVGGLLVTLCAAAAATCVACFLLNGRKNLPGLLACCFSFLGLMGLCLYLCLSGRFLYRAFLVAAIPTSTCCALYAASMPGPVHKPYRNAFVALTVCAFAASLACGALLLKDLRANSPREQIRSNRAVNAYAMASPQNVYFREALGVQDFDAFTTYAAEKPTNLLSWGGCGMRSDAQRRQLAINGISTLYGDAFAGENVYFIGALSPDGSCPGAELLETYLTQIGVCSQLVQMDVIADSYGVYRGA